MNEYMEQISKIAEDCVRESAEDYVGLWQIATRIRREFGSLNNKQVKRRSLDVVRRILELGLRPGDYLKAGFKFWDHDNDETILARIEQEWDPENGDPTLAKPICWFTVQ
jgi:hypothetical protein